VLPASIGAACPSLNAGYDRSWRSGVGAVVELVVDGHETVPHHRRGAREAQLVVGHDAVHTAHYLGLLEAAAEAQHLKLSVDHVIGLDPLKAGGAEERGVRNYQWWILQEFILCETAFSAHVSVSSFAAVLKRHHCEEGNFDTWVGVGFG